MTNGPAPDCNPRPNNPDAQAADVTRSAEMIDEVSDAFWNANPKCRDVTGDELVQDRRFEELKGYAGGVISHLANVSDDFILPHGQKLEVVPSATCVGAESAATSIVPRVRPDDSRKRFDITYAAFAWETLHPEIGEKLEDLFRPMTPQESGSGKLTKLAVGNPYPDKKVELLHSPLEIMMTIDANDNCRTQVLWSTPAFRECARNLETTFNNLLGKQGATGDDDAFIAGAKLGTSRRYEKKDAEEKKQVSRDPHKVEFGEFIHRCPSYLAGHIINAIADHINEDSARLMKMPMTYLFAIKVQEIGDRTTISVDLMVGADKLNLVLSKDPAGLVSVGWADQMVSETKPGFDTDLSKAQLGPVGNPVEITPPKQSSNTGPRDGQGPKI